MTEILGNATLITLGADNKIINNGAVAIKDGKILDIGQTSVLKNKYKDFTFLDLKNKILMPGFIIAHTHLYSSLACGMPFKDIPPTNFIEILERIWWKLDKVLNLEEVYYSSLIGLINCIKHGVTTVVDHHASPNACLGSLDKISKAVEKTGVRSCLCYEVSDRDGKKIAQNGIKENLNFIKRCKKEKNPLLKPAFGLHAGFTLSDETLKKCVKANPYKDVPFHIHAAEAESDVKYSLKKYGKPVLKRLYDIGIAKHPTIAAHCVYLEPEEWSILKKAPVTVIHNPESNMNNAVGCANIIKMLKEKILVGLGTDGFTSDLFQEIKTLPLLHKIISRDPRTLTYDQIYQIAFSNNSKIASELFKIKIGEIKKLAAADLIVLDYKPYTPLGSGNFIGHLIFGLDSSKVDSVMVGGKMLMKNKKLINLDEEKIMAESRKIAQKLWRKL